MVEGPTSPMNSLNDKRVVCCNETAPYASTVFGKTVFTSHPICRWWPTKTSATAKVSLGMRSHYQGGCQAPVFGTLGRAVLIWMGIGRTVQRLGNPRDAWHGVGFVP